ncbi:iron-containing alcohol dehydrogenase [Janibacter alittae]|uniref:Iron-containing alcohol dehydrogenase n=1 Tax=Janibacter alittae TaxID=3115209 RepID=A0ABZ2MD85_9MICO
MADSTLDNVGRLADFDHVIVVTDVGVRTAGHLYRIGRLLEEGGVRSDVLVLMQSAAATVAGVQEIHDRLARNSLGQFGIVALGGGSVVDTCKVAALATRYPWLLDPVSMRAQRGLVSMVNARRGEVPVFAVPTRFGSAAEVAPRAAIAPDPLSVRRLIVGDALVPDDVMIDLGLCGGLILEQWMDGLFEMIFRVIGPFMVTQTSTRETDVQALTMLEEVLSLGERLVVDGRTPTIDEQASLVELSTQTATGPHTEGWNPVMPSWWCIQNTLMTYAGWTKGELLRRALPILFERIEDGATWLGSPERLALLGQGANCVKARVVQMCKSYRAGAKAKAPPSLDYGACARETMKLWGGHPDIHRAGEEGVGGLIYDVVTA